MSATDTIKVGDTLPRIASVTAHDNWMVAVTWASGDRQIVDLAPAIFTYKFYRDLREDKDLFKSIHPIDGGAAIAWGRDDEVDMDASTVARLASEVMEPSDFAEFLKRHKLTYEAAAAQLGISRRLVGYYASERQVPRYIALACAYLDQKLGKAYARRESSKATGFWAANFRETNEMAGVGTATGYFSGSNLCLAVTTALDTLAIVQAKERAGGVGYVFASSTLGVPILTGTPPSGAFSSAKRRGS